ncbi:MAG: hypothetical protein HYV60_06140 [Planctomycetia bacterium]|nr:hypothetical protein [Planctomycetia bacterium]
MISLELPDLLVYAPDPWYVPPLLDVLQIINYLNASTGQRAATKTSPRFDVNTDGAVTPLGALMIINRLKSTTITDGEAVNKLGQAPRSYAKSLQDTDIRSEPVPFFHSLGVRFLGIPPILSAPGHPESHPPSAARWRNSFDIAS